MVLNGQLYSAPGVVVYATVFQTYLFLMMKNELKYYETDMQKFNQRNICTWDFENDTATRKRSVFAKIESVKVFNTLGREISGFLFYLSMNKYPWAGPIAAWHPLGCLANVFCLPSYLFFPRHYISSLSFPFSSLLNYFSREAICFNKIYNRVWQSFITFFICKIFWRSSLLLLFYRLVKYDCILLTESSYLCWSCYFITSIFQWQVLYKLAILLVTPSS